MKALDLLVDLRARGAQVSAIDGQIAIRDRCGTVTAEDRAALAELKAEILELLATAGEIAPSVPEMPAPDPFTPWYPWRAIVATWPVAWRRRWGRRANELEDSGQDWREVERIAFLEVSFSLGAPGGTPPLEASPAWSDRAARARAPRAAAVDPPLSAGDAAAVQAILAGLGATRADVERASEAGLRQARAEAPSVRIGLSSGRPPSDRVPLF